MDGGAASCALLGWDRDRFGKWLSDSYDLTRSGPARLPWETGFAGLVLHVAPYNVFDTLRGPSVGPPPVDPGPAVDYAPGRIAPSLGLEKIL